MLSENLYAEIDPFTNEILRIIVCDSKEWCENNLGGKWIKYEQPVVDSTQSWNEEEYNLNSFES